MKYGGQDGLKFVFKTVTMSLWKLESPMSIVQDDWKLWLVCGNKVNTFWLSMIFKTSSILY